MSRPATRPSMRVRAVRTAVTLAVLALGATACNDDGDGEEEHSEFDVVRLTVTPPTGAAATYTISSTGATPSPVQFRVGTSTITAVGVEASGRTVQIDDDIRIVGSVTGNTEGPLPTGVVFARTGAGAGRLTAASALATPTNVVFRLMHDGHSDLDLRFPMIVAP